MPICGDHNRSCARLHVPSIQFIPAINFANLAGITRRAASKALCKCHQGHTWRGQALTVRIVHGKGGRSGKSYEVRLDSLPVEIQAKWWAENTTDLPKPNSDNLDIAAVALAASAARSSPEWEWRLEVIRPALAHPLGKSVV